MALRLSGLRVTYCAPFDCRMALRLSGLRVRCSVPFDCRMALRLSGLRVRCSVPFDRRMALRLSGLRVTCCAPFDCRMALRLSGLRVRCSARFDCRMALRLSGLRVSGLAFDAVVGRIRRQPPSGSKKAPEGAFLLCRDLRVFQHFADNFYRFFLNQLTVFVAEEAFTVDFVGVFGA